jgi:hypothetical protein
MYAKECALSAENWLTKIVSVRSFSTVKFATQMRSSAASISEENFELNYSYDTNFYNEDKSIWIGCWFWVLIRYWFWLVLGLKGF